MPFGGPSSISSAANMANPSSPAHIAAVGSRPASSRPVTKAEILFSRPLPQDGAATVVAKIYNAKGLELENLASAAFK